MSPPADDDPGPQIDDKKDYFESPDTWTEEDERVRIPTQLQREPDLQASQSITKPFHYVQSLPGKNFRTQILSTFNVSANYASFLAQQELLRLNNSWQAFQIFCEELLNLHRGQGIELFWRDTLTVPTEEQYLRMISNKTGGLFVLAARLMQSVSSTVHDILPFTGLVGLIFQVRDDYQNLCSEQVGVNP